MIRRLVRTALPISRIGVAMWAWRNRDEMLRWAGFAVDAAPRLVDGDRARSDVVAEARLRARLTGDRRTRGADGLRVSVRDGVVTLSGMVDPVVHDVALDLATSASGITRVKDEVRHPGRRAKFANPGDRS